jgi:hypothetical protein
MYRRFPCRYDSYPVAAFSVNDSQEPTFNHSHDDETRFAIMQIEIGLFDRKCILEDTARYIKAYSMFSKIDFGLSKIPFEFQFVLHGYALPRLLVQAPARFIVR